MMTFRVSFCIRLYRLSLMMGVCTKRNTVVCDIARFIYNLPLDLASQFEICRRVGNFDCDYTEMI